MRRLKATESEPSVMSLSHLLTQHVHFARQLYIASPIRCLQSTRCRGCGVDTHRAR